MIEIDGARGEGGGQILRTSLALSLLTGEPFHMQRIRANRAKPGLARQHLVAVKAAAELGGGSVDGAELRSTELAFRPGRVRAGDFRFAIGSAGSTTLVLQTLLPALLHLEAPSTLEIEGGTHNPLAPTYEFLARAFTPLLSRLGARVTLELVRPGFYPAGGGVLRARIEPAPLRALELVERGALRSVQVEAIVANLPRHVGEREVARVAVLLGLPGTSARIDQRRDAAGPGNAVLVTVEHEHVTEVFSAIGEKGVPAERVAELAADEARAYLELGAPVGPHLADQLLLPLALGAGGVFTTGRPTAHTLTQVDTIRMFLRTEITMSEETGGRWRVEVRPPPTRV